MFKKKLKNILLEKLIGGDGEYSLSLNKQLQVLLAIIIIGYFGVKIVYGFFFKFYPDKYYFQNIDINTTLDDKNDNEDDEYNQNIEEKKEYQKKMAKKITLNAFVPGMWNNEMTDFITAMTLTFIIFVFTNITTKSIISEYGNIHPSFLFGYIIGLGYPPVYYNYSNFFSEEFRKGCIIQYLYLAIMVCFIIFIILLNYNSANVSKQENIVSIILVLFGLIYSKKNIESYNSVTYFYRNDQKCMKKDSEPGVVKSSGETVNLNTPFMVFILLLLFSFEPQSVSMKYLYIFIYGFLIGIFISSISYYGIEFFLVKNPQKECIGEDECRQDLMPIIPVEEESKIEWQINKNADNNLSKKLNNPSFNAISSIKIFFIIMILLIFIYLIYFYLVKQT